MVNGPRSIDTHLPLTRHQSRLPRTFTRQYKCQSCRKAKQKCLPENRSWPARCDCCLTKGLPCSAPMLANGSVALQNIDDHPIPIDVDTITDKKPNPDEDLNISSSNNHAKRPASPASNNLDKRLRLTSSQLGEAFTVTGSDVSILDNAQDNSIVYVDVTQRSRIPFSPLASLSDQKQGVHPHGPHTLDSLNPGTQPHEPLLHVSVPTRDLKVTDLPRYSDEEQHKLKSAADMLAVFGQFESACSIYLLLYNLDNIRNGPPQISMYLLAAASRSVVNYGHAEIVGRILNERIMDFSKLRNQYDPAMDLSRPQKITLSLFMAELPTLLSLLLTIKLRALAAALVGTDFTKRKAKNWRTQIEITIEQITSSTSVLTAGEFNLENCTSWERDRRHSRTPAKRQMIIHDPLLRLISKLEAAGKRHYEDQFFTDKEPIALGTYWTRIAILKQALAKSPVSRSPLIENKKRNYLESVCFSHDQAIYLALYSLIWNDLQHPSEPSGSPMVEHWNEISLGEFADVIVMSLMDDATDISYLWLPHIMDEYWERWTSRIQAHFEIFLLGSDDELASWLHHPARMKGSSLVIPQGVAFDFVQEKLRFDVRTILQLINVSPGSTEGAVNSYMPSELLHMLTQASDLQAPRITSPRESSVSSASSFREFIKMQPLRRRQRAASQDMALPSSVIRRSQRSDWSLPWHDSMSVLSSRLSKISISTKNSRSSQADIDIMEPQLIEELIRESVLDGRHAAEVTSVLEMDEWES